MSTRTVYIKTALTGGTTDAVDGIDGDTLLDGDVCHVYVSNVAYQYILDDDSGATESSPDIIAPDSNPGDKRWILQTSAHISDDAYAAGWDGDTTHAPSKNAVYDALLQTILTTAGDIPYASAANVVARLAKGAANTKMFMNAAGTAPEWASGSTFMFITVDMTSATGTFNVTGVGFKPRAIIGVVTGGDSAFSVGLYVGGTQSCLSANTEGVTSRLGNVFARILTSSGNQQSLVISAVLADGFTVANTKSGSPTGTYYVDCIVLR